MQAEKLASVGLLAAGIAHEINNPLTGVLTFAHLVRVKLPEGSAEAEDMDIIIRETKRCAGIIRRLLDFAREKKPEMTHGDLNAVIRETIQFVEHQAGFQNVAFALELDPRSAADLDGPEPAQAGHHEPGGQRPGRHGRARQLVRALAPRPRPCSRRARAAARSPRSS